MKYALTTREATLLRKVRNVPLSFPKTSEGEDVAFPLIEVSQIVGRGVEVMREVDRFSGDEEVTFNFLKRRQ